MPLVKISLQKGWSPEDRQAVLDGVHAALVEAYRIPDHDRHQILHELDPADFEAGRHRRDRFVVIEIIAFPGRSRDAKKNLYAAIVRNLERSPGIEGDGIQVIVHEPPRENWGIRGGRPADEVDLGFRIDV